MTDTTLAEQLARCVREWQDARRHILSLPHGGIPPSPEMREALDRLADAEKALAALDMDALAQEVEAMVGAEREAIAAFIESHAYCTNGGDTCLEPSRFPGMDRHHATIAAAIRAREGGKP
jgi:hypothetical protein